MPWQERVTLDQLRTLRSLARLKSFTLAAEELCLSQPAVSAQIRALEKDCGTELFDRRRKRVLLTQAGCVMLSCAEAVLRRLDEAAQQLEDVHGLRRGRLSLAATHVVGVHVLPEILRRFWDAHPNIEITLQIAFGNEVAERVLKGVVDLGMLGDRDSIRNNRLAVRKLWVDELVVITNSRHDWVRRTRVSAAELASQTFIIERENSAVWETFRRRLQQAGLYLESRVQFGSTDGVKRAVEVGMGISVMPKLGLTAEDVESGRLHVLKLEGIPTEFDICLIWPNDRHLPRVVDAFFSFLGLEGPTGIVTSRPGPVETPIQRS